MDDLSFRLANIAVGNAEGVPGLECTLLGPQLMFDEDTVVAVTRAPAPLAVGRQVVPQW
jgi:urea carboxylase